MATNTFVFSQEQYDKLLERISQTEKNCSQVMERPDSGLSKRFEDLKAETEKVLNKFAEDGKTLQGMVETLSKSLGDTIAKLTVTQDEVRSIGGKRLEHVDPKPVAEVKTGIGLSMFDLFED